MSLVEDPGDHAIIVGYWHAEAVKWAEMYEARLRDYDQLTLLLSIAIGDDWREKLEAKAAKKS